jgi:hypothetical protein
MNSWCTVPLNSHFSPVSAGYRKFDPSLIYYAEIHTGVTQLFHLQFQLTLDMKNSVDSRQLFPKEDSVLLIT